MGDSLGRGNDVLMAARIETTTYAVTHDTRPFRLGLERCESPTRGRLHGREFNGFVI